MKPLRELTDDKKAKGSWSAAQPKEASHTACLGHVAWLNSWDATAIYGCEGWAGHGNRDRYATSTSPTTSSRDDVDRKTLVANK